MTMRERISAGKLYVDYVEGLPADLTHGMRKMKALNCTDADSVSERQCVLEKIFGEGSKIWVDAPIYFRYGKNLHVGPNCTIGFCCVLMDDTDIFIGEGTSINPNVTICTARKPVNTACRQYLYADPVHIGKNCRIGAGSVICPGVTIGDNCYIEAGSIVRQDIPANSVAEGNPCRVIREIGEEDDRFYGTGRSLDPEDLAELEALIRADRDRPKNTMHWKFGDMPKGEKRFVRRG